MKVSFLFLAVLSFFVLPAKGFSNEIYQITVYHFADANQETTLDTYLQTAYLPALHRNKIKSIGVFKPIANDTAADKIIYVIVPFKTLNDATSLQTALDKDAIFIEAGKSYLTASYKNPPYTRMEKILLTAFEKAPVMNLPQLSGDKKEYIYELRSYESPTENYHINKVKMFNEGGEVKIFSSIKSNAVFYCDVIVGSHMPNLMYLTCYESMADRDAHWKTFGNDSLWKQLNTMDEYKNNVSKADIILMHATAYSD